MNLSQLTREQRLLGAAGACALFAISLFLPWYGGFGVDASAADAGGVPAWWVLFLFTVVAGGLLVAEALHVQLPPLVRPLAAATYLTSVAFIVTLMYFLDTPADKEYGLFLALIFSALALVLTGLIWRQER